MLLMRDDLECVSGFHSSGATWKVSEEKHGVNDVQGMNPTIHLLLDVLASCMSCHSLKLTDVDGDSGIAAGHPT
jgi:hypothetical protein